MVDDADDFRFVNTVNNLLLFVVVDEEDLLLRRFGNAVGANNTYVLCAVDDDISPRFRNVMTVIGRCEYRFRLMYQIFDHGEFLTCYGLDKFFRQGDAVQEADKRTARNDGSKIKALMTFKPKGRVF